MNTPTPLKINDTVSGIYFDVPYVGRIAFFSLSGWVHLDLDAPIQINGRTETQIALDAGDRKRWPMTLVAAGEELPCTVRGGLCYPLRTE